MFKGLMEHFLRGQQVSMRSSSDSLASSSSWDTMSSCQQNDAVHKPLYFPNYKRKQAPLPKGSEETLSWICGDPFAIAKLHLAQKTAAVAAKQRPTVLPTFEPYNVHVTRAWENGSKQGSAQAHSWLPVSPEPVTGWKRPLEPPPTLIMMPEPIFKRDVPRIRRFRRVADGFVPLAQLVAESIELTVPTPSMVAEVSASDTQTMADGDVFSDEEDAGIEWTTTSCTSSRWSYSSSSSDSDSSDSEEADSSPETEKYAGNHIIGRTIASSDALEFDTFADLSDSNSDDKDSTAVVHIAERRAFSNARKIQISRPQRFDDDNGRKPLEAPNRRHMNPSKLSNIQPWLDDMHNKPSLPLRPRSQALYWPPLKKAKYHYTTTQAALRFAYIKQYLSLRSDMRPVEIVVYILTRAKKAASHAARKNQALFRAAEDIDWSGIPDDLPQPRHPRDWGRIKTVQMVESWIKRGGHLFTAGMDEKKNPILILPKAGSGKLSWEELLELEERTEPQRRRYDHHFKRDRMLRGRKRNPFAHVKKWKEPGKSSLAWMLTPPVRRKTRY